MGNGIAARALTLAGKLFNQTPISSTERVALQASLSAAGITLPDLVARAINTQNDRRVAILSDSIGMQGVISGNGTTAASDAPTGSLVAAGRNQYDYTQVGFFAGLQQLGGHRFTLDPVMNKGIGGDTTTSMVTRYATDIAANYGQFSWLLANGGTNDSQVGIDPATSVANLKTIYSQALAAGKKVVFFACLPRTAWSDNPTGTVKTQRLRGLMFINAQMHAWARTLPAGAPFWVIDGWSDFSDPANATPTFSAGSVTINAKAMWDSILHPGGRGSYLLGKRAVAEIGASLPNTSWRSRGLLDAFDATYNPTGNALPNLGFVTTTGGANNGASVTAPNGIPANWTMTQAAATGSATIAASEVTYTTATPDPSGYGNRLGNIPQIAVNMASGKANVIRATLSATTGIASGFLTPGRTVYAVAQLRLSGLQGFAGGQCGFSYSPDGGTTWFRRNDGTASHDFAWGQDDHTIWLVSPEMTIPSNPQTSIAYNFSVTTLWDARTANAVGTAQISDVQLVGL